MLDNINKYLKVKYLIGLVFLIVICVVYYFFVFPRNKQVVVVESAAQSFEDVTGKEDFEELKEIVINNIKVHIAGEVVNSGVYELAEGSRVIDLVELAGGATENAELQKVNLARYIQDAEQIIIPKIGEEVQVPSINVQMSASSTLININTATKEELMKLPNVGDVTSSSIISYRENNGGFKTIEDIKKVSGIGTKTFERLKDLITI